MNLQALDFATRFIETPSVGTKISGSNSEVFRISGVYLIKHILTQKVYIGSASDIKQRKHQHFSALRLKKHKNKPLQAAFNDDEDFAFSTIITENREEAYDIEQSILDVFLKTGKLFNIQTKAQVFPSGYKHSPESLDKMRKASAAHSQNPEHIERLRKRNMQHAHPVSIMGISYESVKSASRALSMHPSILRQRVRSQNAEHSDWVTL